MLQQINTVCLIDMWNNEEGCSSASQNLTQESHHGKLRETEASKEYQGIKLVLVTTNLLDNSVQQSRLHKAILIHTQMSLNKFVYMKKINQSIWNKTKHTFKTRLTYFYSFNI